NPQWTASFDELPEHPITRGVSPFEINDEWYYHMRFVPDLENVTPILTDLPPRETLNRQDGHHSGNPYVREAVLQRKEPQHVAWAYERPSGGRGFGFTGGHNHTNWQDDNFRKLVLNAIVWTAQGEVPEEGVPSATPTDAEMEANQDYPKPDPQASSRRVKGHRIAIRGVEYVSSDQSPEHSRALTDAVSHIDVHDELQISLSECEPRLHNPTNIDIDHLGRVWACVAIN